MNILKDYRTHAELSQAAMAEAMGVPLRTYEDIETGRVQIRQVHIHAAQMAVIHLAVKRNDVSVIPAEMWPGLIQVGELMKDWQRLANEKPAG